MDEGRRSRGYLPHIGGEGLTQFVTFHLADAMPAGALEEMKKAVVELPEGERKAEMGRRVEAYCDAGHGECQLRDPRAARLLQEKLFEHHGTLYTLHAWSVMPNHGHVLLTPAPKVSLSFAMQKVKGGSSLHQSSARSLRSSLATGELRRVDEERIPLLGRGQVHRMESCQGEDRAGP